MILAAGLGTRLRPLSERKPKALIEVGGVSLLERVAGRLANAGASRIIVNIHHHAAAIEDETAETATRLGVEICLSREEGAPLETGGGLLHARSLFRSGAPFFLHNVDVLSDFDLPDLYEAHSESGALATLAVAERPASRYLLFDEQGLWGREDGRDGSVERVREPAGGSIRLGFAGIHVVAPAIFDLMTERGAFSIIDVYLRLAGEGHPIRPHDIGSAMWLEVGTPERLTAAREFFGESRRGGG